VSKNKDNMTNERWKMIKAISEEKLFTDGHRNGTQTKRGGKLVWNKGTYKKPKEVAMPHTGGYIKEQQ